MPRRLDGIGSAATTLRAVARTGLLRPARPDRILRMVRSASRWGPTAAAGVAVSAARYPDRPAIVEEVGELDWVTLDRRTNAIARALSSTGIGPGTTVGLLCRNHRGFVEGLVGVAKAGADVVLLNTGFAAPQLAEVVAREGVEHVIHDASFDALLRDAGLDEPRGRTVASVRPAGGASPGGAPTLDELAASNDGTPPSPPASPGAVTILSSGTTGTPKGARRSVDKEATRSGAGSQLGVLTRVPLRSGDPTLVSAPMFHTWGLSGLITALFLSSPVVLRERFDAEDALAAIQRHRVGTVIAVPVMLQRILELPAEVRSRYDTSSLRVVFLSGSALPGGLATRWMDAFGDNLYNLYGSTEVAAVALAGPADLRAAPDTAGPVLPGIDVRLLDTEGREVENGAAGRIFVRSGMLFEGYTGGGTKEVVDGFMSTGDIGRIDGVGRLRVEGREDDMIISGGENVVPQEVEEVLLRHRDVADAAVVGVPDESFGQRLVAHVVAAPDASLDPESLRDWVRQNLATYKVPRDVVLADRLPRNPTGKLLRRQLAGESFDAPVED